MARPYTGAVLASIPSPSSGDIEVLDDGTPQSCGAVTPTVTTTSTIDATDAGSGHNTDFTFDLADGPLAPGTGGPTEGAGAPEIEVTVAGGDNNADGDELTIIGSATGTEDWRLGTLSATDDGVNLNTGEPAPDADDIKATGVESFQLFGDPVLGSAGDDDRILATGETGVLGPLTQPVQMSGREGSDTLATGTGRGSLFGDGGNDTIAGQSVSSTLRALACTAAIAASM